MDFLERDLEDIIFNINLIGRSIYSRNSLIYLPNLIESEKNNTISNLNLYTYSYKKMVGALYDKTNDKARFNILVREIAVHIKQKLKVDDWNTATEEQLKKRDKMHENIILLSDALRGINQIVRISVENALKD